ncbi:MAG TPA: hypothetical protein VHF89_09830 [Solirubrobacteraceae bacterium]|nr:hypothetical protein [Solirubrobacteraceae bacterium]
MRLLLAAVAATATLAVPATSSAVIVPQRGMLGVKLGDTVREVRDRLGPPDGIRFVDNEIIGRQRIYHYGRTAIRFDGDGRRARVIGMTTRSRTERLANGIGVGSTKREVMREVDGVRCPVDEAWHCYLGRLEPGRRVTDFRFRRARVASVTVGRVID